MRGKTLPEAAALAPAMAANFAVVQQARSRVWNLPFIQAEFLGCN
jgi:hypothetical protein